MTTATFATDNATLVRNAIEQGDGAMFAPGYVFHAPPEAYEAGCPSARVGQAAPYAGPFADPHIRVDDVSARDDRVVVRFAGLGRHSAKFRGVAPSGPRARSERARRLPHRARPHRRGLGHAVLGLAAHLAAPLGAYRSPQIGVCAMSRLLHRARTAARVAIFRASRGRALASIEGLPVLLATAGPTSGRRRTLPLLYVENDGALAVAAPGSGNDPRARLVPRPRACAGGRGAEPRRRADDAGAARRWPRPPTHHRPLRGTVPAERPAPRATPTAPSRSSCSAPSGRTRPAPVARRPPERSPLLRPRGRA